MFARYPVVLVVAIAIGCEQTYRRSADDMAIVYGNVQALNAVEASTNVTAFRLPKRSYYREKLAEYKILSGPISLSNDEQARLRSVLLDPTMYEKHRTNCVPDYGVRFQFKHNGKEVDVLLCFECDILGVYEDGVVGHMESFAPGRTHFVSLVKELFPDDAEIATLQ